MSHSVLIIDDDSSFKKLLELKLRSFLSEMRVTSFPNLTEARKFLGTKHSQFDLVVLDQHLPDGRGLELLNEGWFSSIAVLAVSSDTDPEMPGATVQAGAAYFLNKVSISEPLFKPLVLGIIDRNRLQKELAEARNNALVMDTVRKLVGTLRHEINNPLGAVMGATYILRSANPSDEQSKAVEIVESSGKRIKHVLDQICQAVELEQVKKGQETVFHIPGDAPWDEEKEN